MKKKYFYGIAILLLLLPSIILLSKADHKKPEAAEENNGSVMQDFYRDKFLKEKQNDNRPVVHYRKKLCKPLKSGILY